MRDLKSMKNMNLNKKLIFLFIFCFFLFGIFSFVLATPITRNIGAGLTSECTAVGDVYNCKCQKSGELQFNKVNDCHVGLLISDPICSCCGDCTLYNFLELPVNYAKVLLQISGIYALLFFIIGGIMLIMSGGSSERIQKGKKIIIGSITGLIIIIFAFTIVNIMMKALEADELLPDKGLDWVSCPNPGSSPYEALKNTPWCWDCVWTGANKGCQGSNVKSYQSQLNNWGCNCGTAVDGVFGPDTEACTKRFQQANNLSVDGLVGPNTYKAYIKENGEPNHCQ